MLVGLSTALTAPRRGVGSVSPPPPPPPASFSPDDLFNGGEVGGWFDASDFSTMTVNRDGTGGAPTDTDPVGRLIDQGPNGFNFLGDAGDNTKHPTARTINGRNCILFDGVNDQLNSAATVTNDDMTIIIAATVLVSDNQRDSIFSHTSGGSAAGSYQFEADTAPDFLGELNTSGLPSLPPQPSSISGVFTLQFDSAAQTVSLRDDGTLIETATGYAPGSSSTAPNGTFILGTNRGQARFLEYRMGALIVLGGRMLTSEEITDAETWATARLVT